MKKIFLPLFLGLLNLQASYSQDVAPANVYPSNLEENMYFEKYDDASKKITGLHFMVLSDGDNSQKVTPAFTVKLYLMPEGKSSINDLTVVKTYELPGIYQMGSKEYNNEVVDLSKVNVPSGNYRLGIWVNADNSFKEESSDNATLFKGVINYTPNSNSAMNNTIDENKSSMSDEKEEIKSEEDEFSGGFNANFRRNKKETEAKANQNNQQTKQVKEEVKANKQEVKEEAKEVKMEVKEEMKTQVKPNPSNEKKTEATTKSVNKTMTTTSKSSTTKSTTNTKAHPTTTKKK